MTYGIAAYKVTPEFCKEEVDYILSIGGITIKYEQELGRNISLAALQKDYDAVFLGFGVGLARQLDIPVKTWTVWLMRSVSFMIYEIMVTAMCLWVIKWP